MKVNDPDERPWDAEERVDNGKLVQRMFLLYGKGFSTRGAGVGIKSRTPAEMLGWGPRLGVKRSETPGSRFEPNQSPRAADSRIITIDAL